MGFKVYTKQLEIANILISVLPVCELALKEFKSYLHLCCLTEVQSILGT